jgi:hypothetical protein
MQWGLVLQIRVTAGTVIKHEKNIGMMYLGGHIEVLIEIVFALRGIKNQEEMTIHV